MLNLLSIAVWGFAATILLTTLIIAGQSLGFTRIDIPFILGTMFTPNRDLAKVIGVVMHVFNGWIVAIFYALAFDLIAPKWWLGALAGIFQGLFVVIVVLPVLPGIHPRMVSDFRGPEPTRLLEPPGFLATNYGRKTPVVVVVAHAVYGLLLGALYVPK
jgi:hypothetical protein